MTVKTEITLRKVRTADKVGAGKTVRAFHAVGTEFCFPRRGAVNRINVLEACFAVIRILGPVHIEAHVDVPAIRRAVHVRRVLVIVCRILQLRHRKLQLAKLLKKGAGEIEISAVLQRVPAVGPPVFGVVDLEGFVRRKAGDYLFPGSIAFSVVYMPLVTESKTALEAAVRAECGRGNI